MHDATLLRSVFQYDPITGIITWVRPSCYRIKSGQVAGSVGKKGYVQVVFDGTQYRAHRLAWLLQTGQWPVGEVDHKNGIRRDNRWLNLRLATSSQNKHNIGGPRTNNTSGVLGAAFDKQTGRFLASIRVNGKSVHLGRYDEAWEAGAAYLKAKDELHPTHLRLTNASERSL